MNDITRAFLTGETLQLKNIINIARGADPKADIRGNILTGEWEIRYKNLVHMVQSKSLPAAVNSPPRLSSVVFKDLAAFAAKQDDEWQWMKDLCQQWKQVRGAEFRQTHTPKLPPKAQLDKFIKKHYGGDKNINREQARAAFKKCFPNAPMTVIEKLHKENRSEQRARGGRPNKQKV